MKPIALKNMGISIVIPTKNRAVLIQRAVESVLKQTYKNIEIIIVDDGSADVERAQLQEIVFNNSDVAINLILLPVREKGHGPSFSRNTGVNAAKFDYVAFLDDDDELISNCYLEKVTSKLSLSAVPADLILSNQIAVVTSGNEHAENIWLEKYFIKGSFLKLGKDDIVPLPRKFFDNILEFAHINTIILSKELFQLTGGFDESIRYEEDRDLFYRLIGAAKNIWATGIINARHNIPIERVSASSIGLIEKLRLQAIVFAKSINYTNNPQRLKLIVTQLQFIYRKHVEHFIAQEEYRKAIIYAKLSTSLRFSLKWFCYIKYLELKESTHSGNKD